MYYPDLGPCILRNPDSQGDQGLRLYHKRMIMCFDEIAEAAHSWLRWMKWIEGWGCEGAFAAPKQATPSWEHTSECSICSLHQVLMGRNPRARILLAAPPLLEMHTHTHSHSYAVCSDTGANKHKDRCTVNSHTLCCCNWKLHSGFGLSENVRTPFSTLSSPSSSCPCPVTSGPAAPPRLHTGGSVQPFNGQWNNHLLLMRLYRGAQC